MVRYVRSLDSLRAIAALLVVVEHTPVVKMVEAAPVLVMPYWLAWIKAYAAPGYLGVDLFFVLSGFLITRILIADGAAGVPMRYFWLRRALRIFPPFYLLVAIVWIAVPGPHMPWVAAYLANFYFDTSMQYTPVNHTWSLAVEEHFYLVWPLVVYLLSRTWAQAVVIGVLFPAAISTAIWISRTHGLVEGMALVGQITPTRVLSLGAGALLAYHELALFRAGRARTAVVALLAVAAAAGGYWWMAHALTTPSWVPMFAAHRLVSVALLSTGVVALTVLADRLPKVRALDPPFAVLRYVGRISYGLYLYHVPVFYALEIDAKAAENRVTTAEVLTAYALSFAAAMLSYHLMEKRIVAFGKRFRGGRPRPTNDVLATPGTP